jgi:hypothetical protein
MSEKDPMPLPRRAFIASGLLIGSSLVIGPRFRKSTPQTVQKAKEELSADEKKWIDESILAKDLKNYFGQGFSCAESILMVSLRYLQKPEDLVWAAAGFGGGMYQRDLCGFLTGGIMALGVAGGMLEMPRVEAKKICGETVKKYWAWWGTTAPHRCSQIRSEGTTSQVCVNQGLLAAAKIEDLVGRIQNKA